MRVRVHRAITHLRQQWMGALALFLVLTGGVAYAANTVFSTDIVDGEVKTPDLAANAVNSSKIVDSQVRVADISQGAVASDEIANSQVKATDIGDGEVKTAEIATGAVRTEELANGQVQAEDLAPGVAPGASGARAWGRADSTGHLTRSKQVSSVTNPEIGIYCVDPAPEIDPQTAVMVVGTDVQESGTATFFDDLSVVQWDSVPDFCPAGTMEVRGFAADGSFASLAEIDEGGFDLIEANTAFSFVIP